MFRKLYWVTEVVRNDGSSHVGGVYTSIPDLIHHGLKGDMASTRLTLTKLDSEDAPFGVWQGPAFEGMDSKIEEFVRTDEFTKEQCVALMNHVRPKAEVR
jgi:hypothetical protein